MLYVRDVIELGGRLRGRSQKIESNVRLDSSSSLLSAQLAQHNTINQLIVGTMAPLPKKQASTALTEQRIRAVHSSFIHKTLLSKTNDAESNKLSSVLDRKLPGPPIFGKGEKFEWAWRIVFFKGKPIGSAMGRTNLEPLLRSMRGAASAEIIPTAKQIVNGQDSIVQYNVQIGMLSQTDYKNKFGDKDGMFSSTELTEFQTNQTKDGKLLRTITYLALLDDEGQYDEHSAVLAFSNHQLRQSSPTSMRRTRIAEVFHDLFRRQIKIPFNKMPVGDRVVPAKLGPRKMEDFVLDQEEFDSIEAADEYLKDFDEQGYSITNGGREVLDKLHTHTSQYAVREKGSDVTHTKCSSRALLKHMRGGGDPGGLGVVPFNDHLETLNLHMTKKGGGGHKNSFINPSKMVKDVVVKKGEFGSNATYIINGVMV